MTAAPAIGVAARTEAVRLLAATPGGLSHAAFDDLPELLRPGDLLVVNDSATLPAALPAGDHLRLHLSTPLPPVRGEPWPDDGFERWVVELRAGTERFHGGEAGERLALPGGGEAELLARYLGGGRLWAARLRLPEPLLDYLASHGSPIRYRHSEERPLADHQTVFAEEPGSAEMPSAGRPFTEPLVHRLLARGIAFAPITLHTGVSSLESGERPYPERFRVPEATAKAVNAAGRVIAVGTTVVRALETAAEPDGTVVPFAGWTRLVIEADRDIGVVDGMITGWHEPDATHLDMLEAVAGRDLVARSYAAARAHAYRWHEFGDSHLLLP